MSDYKNIFDRQKATQARLRSASLCQKNNHRFLFDWVEDQLADRLKDINRHFDLGLQIGMRHPGDKLLDTGKIKTLLHTDLTDGIGADVPDFVCDEEFLPVKPGSLDLVISALGLHSVNDLPGTLLQIRQALKKDGLFLDCLFGGETLNELRQSLMQTELSLKGGVSPRIFPFADKKQMGALLQRAGFALPVVDSDTITVTYDNMFKLMNDLRGMGEHNIILERSRTNPGKEFFMHAAQYYAENFADDDGRIRARFEIIFLIGWAPHESQQKPLKPGSAQKNLAEILMKDDV